jgi:hypothetical protein
MSTGLAVGVGIYANLKFHCVMLLPVFKTKFFIANDFDGCDDQDSKHVINPCDMLVPIAVLFHIFSILIFIEGVDCNATVSPPLLKEISLITKSKPCEIHIIHAIHISIYKNSFSVFFILIFIFKK